MELIESGFYKVVNSIMEEMNKEERKLIEFIITEILQNAVSSVYSKYILEQKDNITENTFMESIIRNVLESSAWKNEGYYTVSDVKLAIGRELMARLGIEI